MRERSSITSAPSLSANAASPAISRRRIGSPIRSLRHEVARRPYGGSWQKGDEVGASRRESLDRSRAHGRVRRPRPRRVRPRLWPIAPLLGNWRQETNRLRCDRVQPVGDRSNQLIAHPSRKVAADRRRADVLELRATRAADDSQSRMSARSERRTKRVGTSRAWALRSRHAATAWATPALFGA